MLNSLLLFNDTITFKSNLPFFLQNTKPKLFVWWTFVNVVLKISRAHVNRGTITTITAINNSYVCVCVCVSEGGYDVLINENSWDHLAVFQTRSCCLVHSWRVDTKTSCCCFARSTCLCLHNLGRAAACGLPMATVLEITLYVWWVVRLK